MVLQCGYHGWTFDCSGACTRIPSQEHYVPAGFHLRTYPVVEKWQWLWIWMGDPAAADTSLIPDHEQLHLENSDWLASIGGVEPLAGRYQLMNENVLDLTHRSPLRRISRLSHRDARNARDVALFLGVHAFVRTNRRAAHRRPARRLPPWRA